MQSETIKHYFMKKVLSIMLMLMCISLGASAAVKCKAVTLKGTQCTRVAKKDGYCTQHYKIEQKKKSDHNYVNKARQVEDPSGKPQKATSNANRCTATTKKGTRCKLKVIEGTIYCPVHAKR